MDTLLTIEEVSEILKVPISTLRKWCFYRKIPYHKMGRHVRFLETDIEKWIKQKKVKRVNADELT